MNNTFKHEYISQINVTPFVDVMLVLLIIFMVTAPFLTQGLKIDIPETKTVQTLPRDKDKIVISVDKNKKIYIDKYKVDIKNLSKYLKRLISKRNQMVFLKADKNISYGYIVKIMGNIKQAGVEKLGIIAEPEDKK